MLIRHQIPVFLLFACGNALALQPAPPVAPSPATGTVQYAFTPDDRADDMIVAAIARAREQVLVQAFSFTHRRIAEALIRARGRGVEVVLIADYEQTYQIETSVVRDIADAGVPVLLDAQHASAHNKIMVIDGGSADCAVITGSYNFTHAAQFRNAENVVILKGNPPLCEAFRRNWDQHKTHSSPYERQRSSD
jgi:phosphatidylserine/phosphatidylglycerophosphate/cardiolipin synthase-like enzyme